MLTFYRIVYGLVLVVFLGNLLRTNYFATAPTYVSVLLAAAALSLCGLFVLLLRFARIRPTAFWSLVLLWEALFVWYAWFSPAAPFVLHEMHTFDATAGALESKAHYIKAGLVFVVLFAWFLSLPVARLIHGKSTAARLPDRPHV
jgi:hypothetical protein